MQNLTKVFLTTFTACLLVTACSNDQQGSADQQSAANEHEGHNMEAMADKEMPANTTESSGVFIKAEPAVDAVLDRHPRTLRIFLTELPNIDGSSVKLFGGNGEVSLSRFHTMGANDLMIEIDDHPLPNGVYTVEWSARFGDSDQVHTGKYQFTVNVEQ